MGVGMATQRCPAGSAAPGDGSSIEAARTSRLVLFHLVQRLYHGTDELGPAVSCMLSGLLPRLRP
jgi:hypothetical protein